MEQQLEKLHTYYMRRPGESAWVQVISTVWRKAFEDMQCEPEKWEGWAFLRIDATDCPF